MGGVEPASEAERTVEPPEMPGQHEMAETGTETGTVPVAAPGMAVAVVTIVVGAWDTGLLEYLALLLLLLAAALLLAALLLKMVSEALGNPEKLFWRRNTFGTARRGGFAGGWLISAAMRGLLKGIIQLAKSTSPSLTSLMQCRRSFNR